MILDEDEVAKLLRMLELTRPHEIDCSEFLHRMAAFVEQLDPRAAADHRDVLHHMEICPECREEFEALRRLLHDPGP